MAESFDSHACHNSWPQPEFACEESEITAYLWPFSKKTEPATLQEIGFELNPTPEMLYLFVPSSFSGHFEQNMVGKEMEPMPNHKPLEPPSQVLQMTAANASQEESSKSPERAGEVAGVPCVAAKKIRRKYSGATKKPMKKKDVDDDSWMPEGWVKKVNQRPLKGRFPGYLDKKYHAPGVSRAFRSKIEALRYIEKMKTTTADEAEK